MSSTIETSPDLTFDRPGRLAYANAGPDTNGSQFFITEVPYPSLNGGYTIFGQCDNVDVVQKITRVPPRANDKPITPVIIKHIRICNATRQTPSQRGFQLLGLKLDNLFSDLAGPLWRAASLF